MTRDILRDLAPGETQTIQGLASLSDWQRRLNGTARMEVVQRDDGSAYVEFLRYTKVSRRFTDARRVPIEGGTFLALADVLFAPVESDARIDAVRQAARDSGRYVACPKCNEQGWARCRVCHGKGIAPVDRVDAWAAERARATDEQARARGATLMASEFAKEAAARPLTLDGSIVVEVEDDERAPILMGSAIRVEVGRTVKVKVGKTRPITTMSDDVRRHYREVALRLGRDRARQLREQTPAD